MNARFSIGVMTLAGCLAFFSLGRDLSAQPPGGQGGPGGRGGPAGFGGGFFGGGFGGGGGKLDLLQREDVQKELELLDDQIEKAKAAAEEIGNRRGELVRELFGNRGGDQPNETDRDALRERMRERFEKLSQEVDAKLDFLLPHQKTRLDQLEVQFRMRGGGVGGALGSREIADKLKISEEQGEKLRETARGIEEDLRKQLAELRKTAQKKLLAQLSSEQQAAFNEMVGDPFEFQPSSDPQPGRGGFGGPGGPGGLGGRGDRPRRTQE